MERSPDLMSSRAQPKFRVELAQQINRADFVREQPKVGPKSGRSGPKNGRRRPNVVRDRSSWLCEVLHNIGGRSWRAHGGPVGRSTERSAWKAGGAVPLWGGLKSAGGPVVLWEWCSSEVGVEALLELSEGGATALTNLAPPRHRGSSPSQHQVASQRGVEAGRLL